MENTLCNLIEALQSKDSGCIRAACSLHQLVHGGFGPNVSTAVSTSVSTAAASGSSFMSESRERASSKMTNVSFSNIDNFFRGTSIRQAISAIIQQAFSSRLSRRGWPRQQVEPQCQSELVLSCLWRIKEHSVMISKNVRGLDESPRSCESLAGFLSMIFPLVPSNEGSSGSRCVTERGRRRRLSFVPENPMLFAPAARNPRHSGQTLRGLL
ncbi:hypothetical protein GN958_ATG00015 [Phytophthora infestans]|uniref:Uncharacterized protein n=1 Tax=Phytophthora infestans TaxID=4787 RepID=A0A8S9VG53_PHYIN|nr:hypothetical protein GN958_ATG01162 [Phytophthora infestans]KAF4150792.1 hypothetical protein GN958_ATG00015 [Phytophthora infestans]